MKNSGDGDRKWGLEWEGKGEKRQPTKNHLRKNKRDKLKDN